LISAALLILMAAPAVLWPADLLTRFRVHGTGFIQQGIPVRPLDARRQLVVLNSKDEPAACARAEPYLHDPLGRIRWVRLALCSAEPAGWFSLVADDRVRQPPRLLVEDATGLIRIQNGDLTAEFSGKNHIELRWKNQALLQGPIHFLLYPDARSIINAGGRTSVLAPFEPAGFSLENQQTRATVILRGRCPKQRPYNSVAGNNEPRLGFDIEARFHFDALTPSVQYDWRLTNQVGHKAWLERFAMVLPTRTGASMTDSERSPVSPAGSWTDLKIGEQILGIAAEFADVFGPGFGMQLGPQGLLIGGVAPPRDADLTGIVPQVWRQFHYGMSRTFKGWLMPGASARHLTRPRHIELEPRYYSSTGVLPERGDEVGAGEFESAVRASAEWLLGRQWRGTLWAGEWWREWDLGRQQGSEEASNGNSVLAPLYHYFRTGDARMLESAALSAFYVYDVQHDKKQSGFGPMLHTRRHLLDELDWIHPRYQRMFGPLLASHVLLAERERRELIGTLRSFIGRIQAEGGTPYNWDERNHRRSAEETGIDTANIIEALVAAWECTADRFFLDRAVGYARWTLKKWRTRTDDRQWNWNLTRYVLTGLLALCRAEREYPGQIPEADAFLQGAAEIGRHTATHPELTHVAGTLGGGALHYVFYHAWLASDLARLTGDGSLLPAMTRLVRQEVARQHPDGSFPFDLGVLWSQYPTRVVSYYDAKSVVAYLPALAARLAAMPGGDSERRRR
jgi:hypothetical protein